ncbi:MAG: oligosaccharide flippase family protein [Tumebacillaceae bacterium]
MAKAFPIRESGILSLSDLISRLLGLLFLARFVSSLGLESTAAFRITLPLVGVAAAFGSIGLPQALTRLFASSRHLRGAVPRSDLLISLVATLCAACATVLTLSVLIHFTSSEHIDKQELGQLLQFTLPLLLLMCVTGSLRGMLLGLGSTYAPALAQVLEVSSRLLVLIALVPLSARNLQVDGAQLGILTLTAGEAVAGVFLLAVLGALLRRRGMHRDRVSFVSKCRTLFAVLRMSFAPTGQSLLASLGYAMELPFAQTWISRYAGPQIAEQLVAEYAAIALTLLCAPMVLTDGIATALLPLAATERAGGSGSVAPLLRRAIGAVAMIALPTTGALCVLAPSLTAWFGAPSASTMLLLLTPLTLPLYLQAPLASLLQAQGHSRALLLAGIGGDAARIGGLWLGTAYLHFERLGLAIAFASCVLVQTTVLLWVARRILPLRFPWRTIASSCQAALVVAALFMLGLHAPLPLSFPLHPLSWSMIAVSGASLLFLISGEITPQLLSRLPLVGRPLGHVSRRIYRFVAWGNSGFIEK